MEFAEIYEQRLQTVLRFFEENPPVYQYHDTPIPFYRNRWQEVDTSAEVALAAWYVIEEQGNIELPGTGLKVVAGSFRYDYVMIAPLDSQTESREVNYD